MVWIDVWVRLASVVVTFRQHGFYLKPVNGSTLGDELKKPTLCDTVPYRRGDLTTGKRERHDSGKGRRTRGLGARVARHVLTLRLSQRPSLYIGSLCNKYLTKNVADTYADENADWSNAYRWHTDRLHDQVRWLPC
jgi:hypothetical protein